MNGFNNVELLEDNASGTEIPLTVANLWSDPIFKKDLVFTRKLLRSLMIAHKIYRAEMTLDANTSMERDRVVYLIMVPPGSKKTRTADVTRELAQSNFDCVYTEVEEIQMLGTTYRTNTPILPRGI